MKYIKKGTKISFFIFIILLILCNATYSQKVIRIKQDENGYKLTCKVNGIPMLFIFDTGASDVSISLTEANFLIKQGLLGENDFIGKVKYEIANGEIVEGSKVILRNVEIDGNFLENVEAAVIHNANASLLFGMSAINKIGKVVIENNTLLIYPNKNLNSESFNSSKNRENGYNSDIASIKIGKLEVMKEDLTSYLKLGQDYLNWEEAKKACADMGNEWRLPTIVELKIIYNNRKLIGGFDRSNWNIYWSSNPTNQEEYIWRFDFGSGRQVYDSGGNFANVRAVRNF